MVAFRRQHLILSLLFEGLIEVVLNPENSREQHDRGRNSEDRDEPALRFSGIKTVRMIRMVVEYFSVFAVFHLLIGFPVLRFAF